MPAPSRRPGGRPGGRRRGRRGGRGRARGPRPAGEKPETAAEELPLTPESAEAAPGPECNMEPETDTSGDFREPHPEEPVESGAHEENPPESSEPLAESASDAAYQAEPEPEPEPEPASEAPAAPEPAREPAPVRERQSEPAPLPQARRQETNPWTKPADFRHAEASAISQAVAHATEIAEHLRHTLDQLDEILELVELAERQKLADEREIDDLRRALRRIQQPRPQQLQHSQRGPRHDDPQRGPRYDDPQRGPRNDDSQRDRGRREHNPRPEEQRQPRPEPQESNFRSEEQARPPEAGEPPAPID